jgi:eukaryotic-like serine/threonine-protein kinase
MIGNMISRYRIIEKLGAGGMGEVYRAADLNLDRQVAIKILPDTFAGDPERLARFEREAKLLASLNHPNIAAIHGLEEAEGKRFLVLELVEGETLAQRLSKGPLHIEEALEVCRQIADGLEAAHEKGVIHRDLKPANVMITEGDKIKILDFGLAKASAGETQGVDASQSPTLTDAMTQRGVILGTAAYMSPEQAKGKSVDKRADIWAFGCILFECLTGKRPFEGETVTETLAAILKGEPNWHALPATIPSNIRFVLRRCLEKDVSRRFRDAADIRILMEEPAAQAAVSEFSGRKISRAFIASIIIVSLALGCAIAYMWNKLLGGSMAASQPTISHIAAPTEVISAFSRGFALAPNGQTLIFTARNADGRWQLWKRRLDGPNALPMTGTDDGMFPFWSPDGRQVAFLVNRELRRIPAEGGQVQTICTVSGSTIFGSWGDNNEILFSMIPGSSGIIFHVSADGGTPVQVSGFGNGDAIYPQWLPGSRYFLFCRPKGNRLQRIYAASMDDKQPPKQITQFEIDSASVGRTFFFSQPGYLFFNRSGALSVQRFDANSLSLIGQSVAIAGLVGNPADWFALTAAGDKAAMLARESRDDTADPGCSPCRLRWLNRKGEIIGDFGPTGRYWTLRLSPDGLRAAVNPDSDLWIMEAGNRRTRVTSQPEDESSAVWSPDGLTIAFVRPADQSVLLKPAGQGGQETELLKTSSRVLNPTDWSRNGKYLLLQAEASRESPSTDIWTYDFEEKSAKPWLATKYDESEALFSPDGSWVAYVSNANGTIEVYLRPFKGEGAAVLVSPGGGSHPTWRSDGRELFYLTSNDELMAVNVANLGGKPEIGEPRSLFRIAMADSAVFNPYDVAPDGQRFLVNLPETPQPLLFIQGIEELLKRGQ